MKIKIANKLFVSLLLVSMVPLAIAGFVAYQKISDTLQNMILYRLETLAKERVERIERLLAEAQDDLVMLARVPVVAAALGDLARSFSSGGIHSREYREMEEKYGPLIAALAGRERIHDLMMISPAGDVVFSLTKERDLGTNLRTGRYKDTELARVYNLVQEAGETVISEIDMYEPSRAAAVFQAAPVKAGDRLVGVLAMQMPMKPINAVAQDYSGLGETGETDIILARENETIWVAPTRHDTGAAFTRRLGQGSGFAVPAQEAARGKIGRGLYPDYRGVKVLAAWRHIPGLRLGLVIKMDEAETLTRIRTLAKWFLFLGLGTLVAVLAFSLFIARSISRPILELTRSTERMAGGDLSTRPDVRTRDELGDLGLAFNTMAEKLQRETESQKHLSSELETIMDSIPGLVFYKDTENRYVRVNKYVADAHNMRKEDLEGKDLFELYAREQAQAYLDDDLEVINSGEPKLNIDEPWVTETGTRWVSTSKIPYVDKTGKIIGIIGVSMDVTGRKNAEEVIARQTRLIDAINKVFRGALTCKTDEDVAKIALGVAEELTGSKFGFILEINPAGLVDTIAITDPGWDACEIVVSQAKSFTKNMPVRGIDRSTLKEGKSRIVNANEMKTHPDRVGTPQGHPPITCFLGVPFMGRGKAVGMIGLANKEKGYTQHDQDAVETLSDAFYEALVKRRIESALERQNWTRAGQTGLNDRMRGEKPIEALAGDIITYLSEHIGAQVGALFVAEDGRLKLRGRYAYRKHEKVPEAFAWGEGLVGQAAADRKLMLLTDVPENYVVVGSALGQAVPRNIVVVPCLFDGQVKGVVELGSLRAFSDLETEFLDSVAEGIAIAIQTAQAREKLKSLVEETRRQSEILQTQQEELKAANEELEEQTQRLTESEERLKAQQEELQVTNEELEEKNDLLERQKREVEHARKQVEEKAAEVALASRYKSEFLANMSHELRTPLNSLLLLAQGLAQNKEGNLTADQLESARIIHGSGSDLLNLINQILDLSKIEAGRMELQIGKVRVGDLAGSVRSSFRHMAREKGLLLEIEVRDDAPAEITSDHKRLDQVIRNLVSNAIKFTEQGGVTVTFGQLSLVNGHWEDSEGRAVTLRTAAEPSETGDGKSKIANRQFLSIAVKDTGIGIAPGQQKMIFEAFQQADGKTSRKYGGTGLGLSISRELARLLGGEIQLESEVGEGSTFTLYLPVEGGARKRETRNSKLEIHKKAISNGQHQVSSIKSLVSISDDRENIKEGDRTILVIEDDPDFARILLHKCHEKGFKCVSAPTGEMGLELAAKHLPSAVILDIRLPGMDGWAVLQAFKEDTHTRHIPVHVVSVEEASTESFRKGAVGHAVKPVSQEELEETFRRLEQVSAGKPKRVLVVEDDPKIRRETVRLIGNGDVTVDEVGTGADALESLRALRYDCMVLDLGLPDMDGKELLATLEREGLVLPPVIVHTARDLTLEEEMALREHAESIVIKDVRSQERLLDEVSLFLHRVVSQMPDKKRKLIQDLHDTDALLRDKKVLVVDDDMRTMFAVSRLLSERGMHPLKAENGERALRLLDEQPDVALVLMDIMMPVMDGYESIERIRAQERFKKLPIIALTAKAMPEDREKCLAAGANDYLPKPVDAGRLISMMRVWLYR